VGRRESVTGVIDAVAFNTMGLTSSWATCVINVSSWEEARYVTREKMDILGRLLPRAVIQGVIVDQYSTAVPEGAVGGWELIDTCPWSVMHLRLYHFICLLSF
jgi:hypothetical protein